MYGRTTFLYIYGSSFQVNFPFHIPYLVHTNREFQDWRCCDTIQKIHNISSIYLLKAICLQSFPFTAKLFPSTSCFFVGGWLYVVVVLLLHYSLSLYCLVVLAWSSLWKSDAVRCDALCRYFVVFLSIVGLFSFRWLVGLRLELGSRLWFRSHQKEVMGFKILLHFEILCLILRSLCFVMFAGTLCSLLVELGVIVCTWYIIQAQEPQKATPIEWNSAID